MKHLKFLGPLALVSAVALALIGATAASATVLCENNLNTATCGQVVPKTTLFESKLQAGTVADIDPGVQEIECKQSAIGARTENAGSDKETVRLPDTANKELLVVRFEECDCTVAVLATGDIEVHHIVTTDNGMLTSNGLQITTRCVGIFGEIHCIFKTVNANMGTLKGGSPSELVISVALERVATNKLCSEVIHWTGKYEVTTPKPLYVTAG